MLTSGKRYAYMVATQLRKIVDGESEVSFLKQVTNGNVHMRFHRFVRQSRTGKIPSFSSTGFTLLHEFYVKGFRAINLHSDHNVITGSKRSHLESKISVE
jgi:hypothetical protein